MKIIGYVRVSTREQAEGGVSLAMQEEKVQAYCVARDWECSEIIIDAGETGAKLTRPGLEQVIALCRSGATEGVVVLKLDRLTRSVKDLGYLIEDVFEKNGVAFTSVQDNFDTTTANGRLVLNILGTVAQWERDVIAERTSAALQHKKANRQVYGQVPFGFSLGADGETLEDDVHQQEVLTRMLAWREEGLSLQQIADKLDDEAVPTQNGGQWWPGTVNKILNAEAIANVAH